MKMGFGLAGGVIVLLSVFGGQVFKAGDAGIGFLYSARGMGALIGPFVVQALVGRDIGKLRHSIWIAFVLAAVGYLIFGISGWMNSLLLGCVALFIGHFGGGITWIVSSLLLQVTTPDRFRGRVFAVDFGFSTLTSGISTLVYGLALQGGTSPMILAVIGAAIFISFGLVWGLSTGQGRLQISDATINAVPDSLY